jgi:hypothetical protein
MSKKFIVKISLIEIIDGEDYDSFYLKKFYEITMKESLRETLEKGKKELEQFIRCLDGKFTTS